MTTILQQEPAMDFPTHPTERQKADIIDLWRYCFQDGEAFIQWYFKDYYQPEYAYILTEETQALVAAAMQCNPYTLKIRNREIPAAYLAGVCTHPACRGGGYFRRLFPAVLKQLAGDGIAMAFLQPVDNQLYRPYDFTFTHYRQDYILDMTDIERFAKQGAAHYREYTITLTTEPEKYCYLFQNIYQTYHQYHHGYVCRSEENWRHHIADWQIDKAHIALLSCQNQTTAYLIYQLENNQINILEMAYSTPRDYQIIWHYIYSHRTQANTITWSAPIGNSLIEEIPHWQEKCVLHPDTMTRILSVEQLLPVLTYPADFTGAFCLQVKDSLIPANNGIFSISLNQGAAAIHKMAYTPNAYCSINISNLTRLIMGQATALELSRQGLLTGVENQIQALEKLFPKRKNVINESF